MGIMVYSVSWAMQDCFIINRSDVVFRVKLGFQLEIQQKRFISTAHKEGAPRPSTLHPEPKRP